MSYTEYKKHLEKHGYVIIPNTLNPNEIFFAKELFFNMIESIPNYHTLHSKIDPHGINKFLGYPGHTEFAWYCRTRPQIIDTFANLWNTTTDNLVCSFDGSCYIPENSRCNTNCWTHTDQSSKDSSLICYQGFVALTNNKDNSLVVYKNSHKLHKQYFIQIQEKLQSDLDFIKDKINTTDNPEYLDKLRKQETILNTKLTTFNKNKSKHWNLIDPEFLQTIKDDRIILNVKAGDLVIWDSRTFHQNIVSNPKEERLVQYISMLPKDSKLNSKSQQKKRLQYLKDLRTTSHWAYPITVVPKTPRTYGNKDLMIDYDSYPKPNLEPYLDIIKTLV